MEEDEEVKEEEAGDGFLKAQTIDQNDATAYEAIAEVIDEGDNQIKQVAAKVLDFNWIFVGQNATKLLQTLADTENDEIFSCQSIRVFIEFMWQGYY